MLKAHGLPLYRERVREMTLENIKELIPRLYYEGLLMSFDILANEHLRSKDPKKKRGAAAQFLETLKEAAFIKNINLIAEESKAKEKPNKAKAEWK